MYVLDGGQSHVKDISQWSPGVDEGQPRVFSGNVYLIQHRERWMVWDTGITDAIADQPEGRVFAHDARGVVTRTLASQFEELGIAPDSVDLLGISHGHFDHVGNSNLFRNAELYIQRAEYEAMFGHDWQKYGFVPDLYATLRDNPLRLLDGDHDVFGDGAIQVLSTPGHTPGHQSLMLRTGGAGVLVLSGDVAHFRKNFTHRRIPAFNADHEQSLASMERLDALSRDLDAQLLINHDIEQTMTIRQPPQFIE